MSHYTDEPLIEIVGIEASGRGRSCEAHKVCGSALQLDTTVRFRTIQILNGKFFLVPFVVTIFSHFSPSFFFFFSLLPDEGEEEMAIGVYWVTDGIDRCLVGFLSKHCVKHEHKYDGHVAQVVEFLRHSESPSQQQRSHRKQGVCMAALLQGV